MHEHVYISSLGWNTTNMNEKQSFAYRSSFLFRRLDQGMPLRAGPFCGRFHRKHGIVGSLDHLIIHSYISARAVSVFRPGASCSSVDDCFSSQLQGGDLNVRCTADLARAGDTRSLKRRFSRSARTKMDSRKRGISGYRITS